jgi:hypothetical protein
MYRAIFLLSLSFSSLLLGASPWDLDEKTRALLNTEIDAVHQQRNDEALDAGKTYYLVDIEKKRLNILAKNCHYCRFSERLNSHQFKKLWPDQPQAHCFGATLFLIDYLLNQQANIAHSCKEILSEVEEEPTFKETVHAISMQQHSFYSLKDSKEPLELNIEGMKDYFEALIGKRPSTYHLLPLDVGDGILDKASIYTVLKDLPNQLLILGYTDKGGSSHCIAVSTDSKKLFVFDANVGMYQFPDLETLSWNSARVLEGCRFRWFAAFSL